MKKAHKPFTQQAIFNLLSGHCGECLLRPGHASSAGVVVIALPLDAGRTFPTMEIVLQSNIAVGVNRSLWIFGCN